MVEINSGIDKFVEEGYKNTYRQIPLSRLKTMINFSALTLKWLEEVAAEIENTENVKEK